MSDLKNFKYGVCLTIQAEDERAATALAASLYDDIRGLIGEGVGDSVGGARVVALPATPNSTSLALLSVSQCSVPQ